MSFEHFRRLSLAFSAFAALTLLQPAPAASADAQTALRVASACKRELDSFCRDVAAGGGRKIACLYAYGDRLSLPCERAFYDVAVELERAVAAVRVAAQACAVDIGRHCATVVPGQGRVALCLAAHKPSLSPSCTATLAALSQ